MNYDEFEPVSQPDSGGYYSTGAPAKHPRHVGLTVAVSLLIVIGCAVLAVLRLFDVRVERSVGRLSLTFIDRSPDISAVQMVSTDVGAIREELQSSDLALHIAATPAQEETLTLQALYQKVIPGVVSVISSTPSASTSCCGIILSDDGYIITNSHIVTKDSAITVLAGGEEYIASVVGSDALSDLAVLKVDADGLTPAEFGDSRQLLVGEQVVTIGDPLGLGSTMTDGILSAIHQDLNLEGRTITILQTNATLHAGGYGGPLVNRYGQVIGINAMTLGSYSAEKSDELGLAISIDAAKGIIDELIAHGSLPGRPAIGISGQSVPAAAQAYYGLPAGVYIESVEPGSSAEKAGLSPGDIITALHEEPVSNLEELNLEKNRYKSGDTVMLTVFRAEGEIKIPIVLDETRR